MKLGEIKELIRLQPPIVDPIARRLSRCLTTDDVRRAARARLPRAVFDYVDGGADDETTLRENRAAFSRALLHPRAAAGIGAIDLGVELFGRHLAAPLALCPTGYTQMMHVEGERAVARAAASRGVAYTLSTMGTTTIEELAAVGHDDLWFQLYPLRDRALTDALVKRAQASGYRLLEVAIDTTVSGRRERDVRNGLTIPPALRPRTVLDIGMHPGYWTAMVRGPALRFANLGTPQVGEEMITAANIAALFDPSVSWDDLAHLRSLWDGPMLVKGPLGPEDAARAVDLGYDGVHLSNHGGRQLDRCVPAVELVRPVRERLGDGPVIVLDSGIRHGADIAVGVARGADLCAIGRAYLYGLAAAGEVGVTHVLDLLLAQLTRTMHLLGVGDVHELRTHGGALVTLPGER